MFHRNTITLAAGLKVEAVCSYEMLETTSSFEDGNDTFL
jgi:hypothetical protein